MRCERLIPPNGERQCARAHGHVGECRSIADVLGAPLTAAELADVRRRVGDDVDRHVVNDPDAPLLPFGCIHTDALDKLADAMHKLEVWHVKHGGHHTDRPCLRRLESSNGIITAHISSGPAVGGSWLRLEYARGKWAERA